MVDYNWIKYTTEYGTYTCPIHKTVLLIGDKWTLFILREFIYNGEKQSFNQLLRELKPISSRTLSKKLKILEQSKLVERKVLRQKPLQTQYKITKKGKSLKTALAAMSEWYKKYN